MSTQPFHGLSGQILLRALGKVRTQLRVYDESTQPRIELVLDSVIQLLNEIDGAASLSSFSLALGGLHEMLREEPSGDNLQELGNTLDQLQHYLMQAQERSSLSSPAGASAAVKTAAPEGAEPGQDQAEPEEGEWLLDELVEIVEQEEPSPQPPPQKTARLAHSSAQSPP